MKIKYDSTSGLVTISILKPEDYFRCFGEEGSLSLAYEKASKGTITPTESYESVDKAIFQLEFDIIRVHVAQDKRDVAFYFWQGMEQLKTQKYPQDTFHVRFIFALKSFFAMSCMNDPTLSELYESLQSESYVDFPGMKDVCSVISVLRHAKFPLPIVGQKWVGLDFKGSCIRMGRETIVFHIDWLYFLAPLFTKVKLFTTKFQTAGITLQEYTIEKKLAPKYSLVDKLAYSTIESLRGVAQLRKYEDKFDLLFYEALPTRQNVCKNTDALIMMLYTNPEYTINDIGLACGFSAFGQDWINCIRNNKLSYEDSQRGFSQLDSPDNENH